MRADLISALRPAIAMTALFALLLGIAYPLGVTGIAQLALPHQANGSLIRGADGRPVGSALIGQAFARPDYFHGRPSAAGSGYDAMASSGSNLAPTSKALAARVRGDVAKAHADGLVGPVPADLVTASGSGLDPDLSPAAARAQVARIAEARGVPRDRLYALVDRAVQHPLLGFIGEDRVNVLALNQELDRMRAAPR